MTPVVILAGGRGARFDHESQVRPKPLIEVAGRPILGHIMDLFEAQGFHEFIIAVGYLGEQVFSYFNNQDWSANTRSHGPCHGTGPALEIFQWTGKSVTVVDTGLDSHTGERLLRLKDVIGDRTFILTYGDGLSDVDMRRVLTQHEWANKIKESSLYEPGHPPAPLVTITAVHPRGRFGVITMDSGTDQNRRCVVSSFDEKPSAALINGGFMVIDPKFIGKYLDDDMGTYRLEAEALPAVAAHGRMQAYVHDNYWACMDTRRDLEQIEEDVLMSPDRLPWRRP